MDDKGERNRKSFNSTVLVNLASKPNNF